MKRILFLLALIFALAFSQSFVSAGGVPVEGDGRMVRADGFFSKAIWSHDASNQTVDQKIKATFLTIRQLIDKMAPKSEVVVIDSGSQAPKTKPRLADMEDNTVAVIGSKGYAKVKGNPNQITINFPNSDEVAENLGKYEKRDLENGIAGYYNKYGMIPAEVRLTREADKYVVIFVKSDLTGEIYESRQIIIRTVENWILEGPQYAQKNELTTER